MFQYLKKSSNEVLPWNDIHWDIQYSQGYVMLVFVRLLLPIIVIGLMDTLSPIMVIKWNIYYIK